jgi:arylsulfatase A-like enzyme
MKWNIPSSHLRNGWFLVVLAAVCFAAPVAAQVPDPPPPSQEAPPVPSLLLITIEAWRWDSIGASGSGRVATPNLDRLAREGVYEREIMTSSPQTVPALVTVLSGLEPARHGVLDNARFLMDPSVPSLPLAFGPTGAYATAAFLANDALRARFDIGRGFELFYDTFGAKRRSPEDWLPPKRDGSEITDAVLRGLPVLAAGRSAFVWAHYADLILPRRPHPGFDDRYPDDPYAAQTAYLDAEIGRLVSALQGEKGKRWRIVVVGCQGEGLGEKGEDGHGLGLYRGTLHVPLILHPKPEQPLRSPRPWGLVDLAPTIREWFGLPAAEGADGVSLFQPNTPARVLHAVSTEPALLFGAPITFGVRQGRFLYLKGGSEHLYDLEADPSQERDLIADPALRDELERLRDQRARTWPEDWIAGAVPPVLRPSPEFLKELLRRDSPPRTPRAIEVRDILKDKSEWDRERETAFRTGKDDKLLELYPKLLEKYPGSYALRNNYAPLLAKAGRRKEAVALLEETAQLFPRDELSLFNLAAVHLAAGRSAPAKGALEEAVRRNPASRLAHKAMGILYAEHLGDPGKAVESFKRYLDLGGDEDAPKWKKYIEAQEAKSTHAP